MRGVGGRSEVGRGEGGRGQRRNHGTHARAAVGRRRVTFDGFHGEGGSSGGGGLPLPHSTSTPAGEAASNAGYASTRSVMMAGCRIAHVGGVVGEKMVERDERIKRIEHEKKMEVDAALAASRAVAATEAAARMAQSIEMEAEARGYKDAKEPVVYDDASPPAPAAAAEPVRQSPMDVEAAF